jgi:hypothetical protein
VSNLRDEEKKGGQQHGDERKQHRPTRQCSGARGGGVSFFQCRSRPLISALNRSEVMEVKLSAIGGESKKSLGGGVG